MVCTTARKEGGGHRVRERSRDKKADTRSADNRCLTYSRPKKGARVLHPLGCCINAAIKTDFRDDKNRLSRRCSARAREGLEHRGGAKPRARAPYRAGCGSSDPVRKPGSIKARALRSPGPKEDGRSILVASSWPQQLGPRDADIVLGESAWVLTDFEYRIASVLVRTQLRLTEFLGSSPPALCIARSYTADCLM